MTLSFRGFKRILQNDALIQNPNLIETMVNDEQRIDLIMGKNHITVPRLILALGMPRLIRLDLSDNVISIQLGKILQKFSSLRYLIIEESNVGDQTINYVSKLTDLRQLYIKSNNVTLEGLFSLRKVITLQKIDISNNPIQEKSINFLLHLPNMTDIIFE